MKALCDKKNILNHIAILIIGTIMIFLIFHLSSSSELKGSKESSTSVAIAEYKNAAGEVINYYQFHGGVENIDYDALMKKEGINLDAPLATRNCFISDKDGIIYEMENRFYLVWEYSKNDRLVIAYPPNTPELEIIKMAESVE